MPGARLVSEDIYDAIVDDECFAELPGRLASSFGGRSSLIHWAFHDGGSESLSQCGFFTDELLTRYAQEFVAYDPWLLATASEAYRNRAMNLEEVVPAEEFAGSFFYNEFTRPMGDDTFRCLGVRIANRWGSGIIAIHRGRNQPSFDPATADALDHHVAALRRVLSVRGRLAALNRRLDSVETMLDHMGHAALLVRRNGSLVHANTMGEALLRRGDALVQRRGVLAGGSSRSTMRLRQAIATACAPAEIGASALLIERSVGRPLAVSIVPLRTSRGDRHALLIIEPESTAEGSAPRLQSLYGLTRAEAEIGLRIADGVRPQWIADERGVSVETVRSQIKSLSAKLGCRRQSEIVSAIKALPATNLIRRASTG